MSTLRYPGLSFWDHIAQAGYIKHLLVGLHSCDHIAQAGYIKHLLVAFIVMVILG
jgi:hypothetical protein